MTIDTAQGAPKTGAAPPFKISPAGLGKQELTLLFTGPPGSGKTTLLGTMPGRGLVINTLPMERGARIVLANKRDRIDVTDIQKWEELSPVLEWLKQPRERHGYDWVALDSFTGLNPLAKNRALNERASRGINANRALMTKPDWGNMGGFLYEGLSEFLGLKIQKLVTAQESSYEIEGLDSRIGPDTRPPVIGFLLASMNGIGRIYSTPIGGGRFERRMLVAERPPFMAKWQIDPDRTEWPAVIRNPNLETIINYAYGPVGKYPPPDGVDEEKESAATATESI